MNKTGQYYKGALSKTGEREYYRWNWNFVHRLMAETYNSRINPEGKPIIDHINGNTLDNNIYNLRGATYNESNQNRGHKL